MAESVNSSEQWELHPLRLQQARGNHAAVVINNSQILITGGGGADADVGN